MLHDPNTYPNPNTFNPSRFMTPDGRFNTDIKDPFHAVFGFGRRICPGRFIAASTNWIAIASLIAVFDFERVDETAGVDHPYGAGVVQ